MKKTVVLLLTVLMLLPMAVACAKDKPEVTESSVETSEGSGLLLSDKLKDVKFNGETIDIWQVTNASNDAEYFYDMNGSVENGDFISFEIFKRNTAVEELLQVDINFVDTGSKSSNAATDCRPLLQAGSTEFDAYQLVQWNGIALVLEGHFKNLDDSKYLDFDREWWSQDFMDAAKLNGHNYIVAGDVGIDMVANTAAVFVNKDMLAHHHGVDAYENLRADVLDGKWTMEEMTRLSKDTYADLNKNDEVDISDQFGFLCSDAHIIGLYISMGGTVIQRNGEGKAVLTMGDENSVNIMNVIYNVMHVEDVNNYGNNAGAQQIYNQSHTPVVVEKFSNGEMLFNVGYFYTARNLTNMEDGFAPLPCPKYDVDQKEYYSYIHNIVTLYAIPVTCELYDQTGAALEAMASLGKQNIVPFYYESVLKLRYLDDEGDTRLVDMIYDSRTTDIGCVLNNEASTLPRYMIQYKRNSLAWCLRVYKNDIEKGIEEINSIKF